MANASTTPAFSELVSQSLLLDKLLVEVNHRFDPRIGRSVRDSLEFSAHQDRIRDEMVYRLNACILAEKLVDKTVKKTAEFEHKVTYPETWWQHFKRDVLARFRLTRWYVRKWPVRRHTEYKFQRATLEANFKQYAAFPSADLILTPDSVHQHLIVPTEELSIYWKAPS